MKSRFSHCLFFILLEMLTLFLCSQGSWTIHNLSMVGNLPDYRRLYFLWAFLFSITFYHPLIHIKPTRKSVFYQILTKTSFCTFLLSVFIPFDVNSSDLLSMLHVPLAAISLFCILASLFVLINLIRDEAPQRYFPLIKNVEILLLILAISILIFSQINSIVEFLFITLIVPFIQQLYHRLNH